MSFQMAAIPFCTKCSKDASDEGTRRKFFPASMDQFGSLAFTLLTKAVPCRAVPCHVSTLSQSVSARTARHDKTQVYTGKKSGVVRCHAVLAHFLFASVNAVLVTKETQNIACFSKEILSNKKQIQMAGLGESACLKWPIIHTCSYILLSCYYNAIWGIRLMSRQQISCMSLIKLLILVTQRH